MDIHSSASRNTGQNSMKNHTLLFYENNNNALDNVVLKDGIVISGMSLMTGSFN